MDSLSPSLPVVHVPGSVLSIVLSYYRTIVVLSYYRTHYSTAAEVSPTTSEMVVRGYPAARSKWLSTCSNLSSS